MANRGWCDKKGQALSDLTLSFCLNASAMRYRFAKAGRGLGDSQS